MPVRLKQTMAWKCDACGEKHQDIFEVPFGDEWSEALAPERWRAFQKQNGEWLFFCWRHTILLQVSTKEHPMIFEVQKGLKRYTAPGKD